MAPTIVDLFSGCGGFGLGAKLAGFDVDLAIDCDKTLQSAYALNFPNTRTLTTDITAIKKQSWKFLLNEKKIDGVIGGPPCQGFSRIGKKDKRDPRRQLLHDFFDSVVAIRPKFFVMENVEGLLDGDSRAALESAISVAEGYYSVLQPFVVDASHFGAPTKRRRVLVIGFDKEHLNPLSVSDFDPPGNEKTTVRQAISDIPRPIPSTGKTEDFGWNQYRPGRPSSYAQMMKNPPPIGLGSALGREMLGKKMVSGLFGTEHTPAVTKRFDRTPPGKLEAISRYPRLSWEGQCPTLRAGTGSDRGSYQAVRPLHPDEPRVITVREAARLQGFPDWFLFHPAKWHSFRMIGNSVSPILSRSVLSIIAQKLLTSNEQRVAI